MKKARKGQREGMAFFMSLGLACCRIENHSRPPLTQMGASGWGGGVRRNKYNAIKINAPDSSPPKREQQDPLIAIGTTPYLPFRIIRCAPSTRAETGVESSVHTSNRKTEKSSLPLSLPLHLTLLLSPVCRLCQWPVFTTLQRA
jgi:hypothetical protein